MEGQRNCTHGTASSTHPALLLENHRLSLDTTINSNKYILSSEGFVGSKLAGIKTILNFFTSPTVLLTDFAQKYLQTTAASQEMLHKLKFITDLKKTKTKQKTESSIL